MTKKLPSILAALQLQRKALIEAINNDYWTAINQLDEIVATGVEISDDRVKEHTIYADQLLGTINKVYDIADRHIQIAYQLRCALVETGVHHSSNIPLLLKENENANDKQKDFFKLNQN